MLELEYLFDLPHVLNKRKRPGSAWATVRIGSLIRTSIIQAHFSRQMMDYYLYHIISEKRSKEINYSRTQSV